MSTRKFNARWVESVKPSDTLVDFRDSYCRGLRMRIFQSGRKTWSFEYRTHEGIRRVFKLGDYPDLSLSEVRMMVDTLRGQVAVGKDPQAERERLRRRVNNVVTVGQPAEEYLERYARRHKRPRSVRDDEGLVSRYVLPAWRKRRADEITPREIKALLEDLADGKVAIHGRATTIVPRQLRALLSKIFSWAVEEELLPANSAAGIPLPIKSVPRDRVLSEEEICKLCKELESLDIEAPISAAAFRLLVLTMQRPGEVLGMR